MSILGRLRRRGTAATAPAANGGAPPAPDHVGVDTFEYVRVGRTALTRAAGRWLSDPSGALDFTLEVSVGGKQVDSVRALVEAPGGKRFDRETWRAAFPTSLDALEEPDVAFALVAGHQRIELDPPVLRELEKRESGWRDDAERRVREAEAGVAWLQDQLWRERDRRRALEVEIAAVRAEREHALSPTVYAAEERYREVRYGLSRVRAASGEMVEKLEEALDAARAVAGLADAEPAKQEPPEAPAGAAACTDCDASGACSSCGGSGRRRGRKCRACAGSGSCRTCAGMGWVLGD